VTSSGKLVFRSVGDRSSAYRVAVAVTSGAASTPVTTDWVIFNSGRYAVVLGFEGVAQPLPGSLEQEAVALVASRLR
jgi:hypothetical protein